MSYYKDLENAYYDDLEARGVDETAPFNTQKAGVMLQQLMDANNTNAYKLGEILGTHPNSIYNWTKYGAEPSYANVVKCLNAMGYSIRLVKVSNEK